MTTKIDQPEQLISTVRELGGDANHIVAVDLELFFDQNEAVGSIAPNLIEHPGPQEIYRVLQQVRSRPDVSSVQVLVQLEYDEYPEGEWPYGVAVLVVTSASLRELDDITAAVDTDPSIEGAWDEERIANPPVLPDGQRYVSIWWD